MTILDVAGARHFCARFGRRPGSAEQSIRAFVSSTVGSTSSIPEGSSLYEDYRDCLLRDAERNLFLAASLYRRALDLMTVGACSWCHVTLYYASYFASSGLMQMFGAWADPPHMLIEVVAATPGSQTFAVRRRHHLKTLTTYTGSHRIFWDLYYKAWIPLVSWVPPQLQAGITPVSSDPMWQIFHRNEVNYDSFVALELAAGFQRSFRPSGMPHCLPGTLSTQFQVSRATVELAFLVAKDLRLRTDAFTTLGTHGRRRDVIRTLVYNTPAPSLRREHRMGKLLV